MVVTQPRRIAAISISERVAYEQLQDTTGGQVGFRVRLESSHSEKTQLLFMTPGVLLRQLQSDPFLQGRLREAVPVIFLVEVFLSDFPLPESFSSLFCRIYAYLYGRDS